MRLFISIIIQSLVWAGAFTVAHLSQGLGFSWMIVLTIITFNVLDGLGEIMIKEHTK